MKRGATAPGSLARAEAMVNSAAAARWGQGLPASQFKKKNTAASRSALQSTS